MYFHADYAAASFVIQHFQTFFCLPPHAVTSLSHLFTALPDMPAFRHVK